ncbi:extensin-like protein [Ciceribacter lividus]|uniref:Extensin-like protein n=1 Tax=Ciceribacter lividus TaxID=1197950 RepID=A0A6I7HVN1_9HYPH|nr:extensin-like protein [Ciceribacter lividus]
MALFAGCPTYLWTSENVAAPKARSGEGPPLILMLDEPISALDVSIQQEILNLLMHLREHEGLTYILVGNDLAVISHLCDRTAAFQRALNAAACLYFTTFLSPGSDETHRDHMHLDGRKRTGGYRYCR